MARLQAAEPQQALGKAVPAYLTSSELLPLFRKLHAAVGCARDQFFARESSKHVGHGSGRDLETLGEAGAAFLERLKERVGLEGEAELRDAQRPSLQQSRD